MGQLCNKVDMRAIIFPGQGAQYVGMGKSFYDGFSRAKNIFSSIDDISGLKISQICFSGPEEELKKTAIQQLTILAVSLAGFEVFKNKCSLDDIKYFSGLSLGEYSCLYASEVLTLEEVVSLVKERGLAMEEASKKNISSMFAVIGLTKELLQEKQNSGFYIANINSPNQVVISLAKDKRQEVRKKLEELGAKVVELQVSGGFHSPFMEPAREHLKKIVDSLNFRKAKVPIVSNFTAEPHDDPESIKNNLTNQLVYPVLWKNCVELMVKKGVINFLEVGPSKVLKGLMRKIDRRVEVMNIEKAEDLDIINI